MPYASGGSIRRWELQATVVQVVDPAGFYPEVRLGDSVRGALQYDLSTSPSVDIFTPNVHFYTHRPWFEVAAMVIENSRGGSETQFVRNFDGEFATASVFDDWEDDLGQADSLVALQSVVPPQGYVGIGPAILVQFQGPPDRWSSYTLPWELELDSWPIAAISFVDVYGSDEHGTVIHAEIFSVTATEVSLPAADFDGDGYVQAFDLEMWSGSFRFGAGADADSDGDTDGADFLAWQRQLGAGPTVSSQSAIVPEPRGAILIAVALLTGVRHRAW